MIRRALILTAALLAGAAPVARAQSSPQTPPTAAPRDGVIPAPPVDPDMHVQPPVPPAALPTPVIPPPGTGGADPNVVPK